MIATAQSDLQRIWIILSKELRSFFYTPTVYVCLALFVFLVNYLTFVVGDFFERNEASLAGSFFRWHPWLYAFFAPAICMRLWSEEYRQKTLELLITMGFQPWHLVCGKFLAAWLVLIAALLLTLPIVIVLYALGPPDGGAIFSGYFGSALLSGSLLSVSLAAASFSRNQFISYILGAGICAIFLLLGSTGSMNVLIVMFSGVSSLAEALSHISFTAHFKHFQLGVISISGVVYFLSVGVLSLFIAQYFINFKRK